MWSLGFSFSYRIIFRRGQHPINSDYAFGSVYAIPLPVLLVRL